MGLDMFITGKRHLWDMTDESKEFQDKVSSLFSELDDTKVKMVEVEFAYWRKANAIHNWFVKNVQDGEDDCKETYLEKADVQKLLYVVNEVLRDNTKASELLPTSSGFFFGDTSYSENYFNQLEYTKDVLTKLIDKWDTYYKNWGLYYQASW
jgi:hypothetical protein